MTYLLLSINFLVVTFVNGFDPKPWVGPGPVPSDDSYNIPEKDSFNLKTWTGPGLLPSADNDDDNSRSYKQVEFGNEDQLPEHRIINGQLADMYNRTQFPYVALLKYGQKPHCGVSIIAPRWLLTAGHCVISENKPEPRIIVGTIWSSGKDGAEYHVERLIRHERYQHIPAEANNGIEYIVYDIGLIRLTQSIIFSDSVRPISIPQITVDYSNQMATIVGWGRTYYGSPTSPILLWANVRIMTPEECRSSFPYASEIHFCTSTEEYRSVCYGDSGGPVILNDIEIGLISTAEPYCQINSLPNLHTNVPTFYNWIANQLNMYGERLP